MLLCLPPLRIPIPFSGYDLKAHMPGARLLNPHAGYKDTPLEKVLDFLPFKVARHISIPKISRDFFQERVREIDAWVEAAEPENTEQQESRKAIAEQFKRGWENNLKGRTTTLAIETQEEWLPPFPLSTRQLDVYAPELKELPSLSECAVLRRMRIACQNVTKKPDINNLRKLQYVSFAGTSFELSEEDIVSGFPRKCYMKIDYASVPHADRRDALKEKLNTQFCINALGVPRLEFTDAMSKLLRDYIDMPESDLGVWQKIDHEKDAAVFARVIKYTFENFLNLGIFRRSGFKPSEKTRFQNLFRQIQNNFALRTDCFALVQSTALPYFSDINLILNMEILALGHELIHQVVRGDFDDNGALMLSRCHELYSMVAVWRSFLKTYRSRENDIIEYWPTPHQLRERINYNFAHLFNYALQKPDNNPKFQLISTMNNQGDFAGPAYVVDHLQYLMQPELRKRLQNHEVGPQERSANNLAFVQFLMTTHVVPAWLRRHQPELFAETLELNSQKSALEILHRVQGSTASVSTSASALAPLPSAAISSIPEIQSEPSSPNAAARVDGDTALTSVDTDNVTALGNNAAGQPSLMIDLLTPETPRRWDAPTLAQWQTLLDRSGLKVDLATVKSRAVKI